MINIYETIFNEIATGIVIASLSGEFKMVNGYMCQLLGYSEEELLQLNISDITHQDSQYQNMEEVKKVVYGQRDHVTFEKQYIRKDRSVFWGLVTVKRSHLAEYGDVFISQVQEITAHKKLENDLKKDALVSLATTYSHKINNPLAVAKVITSKMLAKPNSASLDYYQKLDKMIDRINDSIKKINSTVDQDEIELTKYHDSSRMIKT